MPNFEIMIEVLLIISDDDYESVEPEAQVDKPPPVYSRLSSRDSRRTGDSLYVNTEQRNNVY